MQRRPLKLNICFFYWRWLVDKKYNQIWDYISNIMRIEFDSKPVSDEKYLKIKTKSYGNKINTSIYNNEMPKECCHCVCLLVI